MPKALLRKKNPCNEPNNPESFFFLFLFFSNSIILCSILYNVQILMLNRCATHPFQSERRKKRANQRTLPQKTFQFRQASEANFLENRTPTLHLRHFQLYFPDYFLKSFRFWLPPNAGRGWNSFSHNSPLLSDLNTSWQSSSPLQGVDWMVFQRHDLPWPQQATIFGSSLGLPQRSFCPVRVTLGLSPKFRQCAISLGLKEWKAKSWSPAPCVAMVAFWNPIDPICKFGNNHRMQGKMTGTELVLSCWQKWHEWNSYWGYSNSLDKEENDKKKQSAVYHRWCEALASWQLAKATLKWITQCKHACRHRRVFWAEMDSRASTTANLLPNPNKAWAGTELLKLKWNI